MDGAWVFLLLVLARGDEDGDSGSTPPACFLGFIVSFSYWFLHPQTHMISFVPLKTIQGKYFPFIDLITEVQ